MNLALTDVEIPGGDRFEHHVIRAPAGASGTVVVDAERGVLLVWRHRFATDTWGWEVPAGRIDEGESPRAGRGQGDARGDGLAARAPSPTSSPTTRTTASPTCGSTCSRPTGQPMWARPPTGPRSSGSTGCTVDELRTRRRLRSGGRRPVAHRAALVPGLRAGLTMSVPSISRLSASAASRWRRVSTCVENRARPRGDGGEHVVHRLGRRRRAPARLAPGLLDQAAEERPDCGPAAGRSARRRCSWRARSSGTPTTKPAMEESRWLISTAASSAADEACGEVGVRHDGLLEDVVDHHLHLLVDRDVEVGLGGEVVVDRAGGDPDVLGDVLVGRGVVALAGERPPRRVQDLLAGLGRVDGRRSSEPLGPRRRWLMTALRRPWGPGRPACRT